MNEAAEWIEAQRALWTRRLRTLDALLRQEDLERRARKSKRKATDDRI
jgi:hypothetical protein